MGTKSNKLYVNMGRHDVIRIPVMICAISEDNPHVGE